MKSFVPTKKEFEKIGKLSGGDIWTLVIPITPNRGSWFEPNDLLKSEFLKINQDGYAVFRGFAPLVCPAGKVGETIFVKNTFFVSEKTAQHFFLVEDVNVQTLNKKYYWVYTLRKK